MRGDGRIFRRGSSWWIAYCHRGKEIRESVDRYFRERGDKSKQITDKQAQRLLKLRRGEVGADLLGAKPFVGRNKSVCSYVNYWTHCKRI